VSRILFVVFFSFAAFGLRSLFRDGDDQRVGQIRICVVVPSSTDI